MKTKTLNALAACMAVALAVQVSTGSTPSVQHPAAPAPPTESAADAVVLTAATLDAVTGAVNWGKLACWTTVVVFAVASPAAPGAGAAAAVAMAGVCLILY